MLLEVKKKYKRATEQDKMDLDGSIKKKQKKTTKRKVKRDKKRDTRGIVENIDGIGISEK